MIKMCVNKRRERESKVIKMMEVMYYKAKNKMGLRKGLKTLGGGSGRDKSRVLTEDNRNSG